MSAESFLEMLAREAPAIEFENPLLDARARGADAATLAGIEQAKLLALQVRDTLEERRRREAELRALYETANDLAALRDLDAVLQAITHRARQLLGTDVAYLSLNDPERGDTYMRVTDGALSPLFQQVRLPLGAGLGGLVAQSATPYATSSYFEDERFRHTTDIDSAVGDEGLVGILGVPLLLGDKVLGVLYAANRSVLPFSREEVALLVSLAAHAAIAIDSARLIEEMRRALADLEAANELVRSHSRSVERAAAAHDRFADLLLHGGGADEVAAAVADVLGGGIVVIDESGRVLAVSPGAEPGDAVEDGRLSPALDEAVRSALTAGRAARAGGRWVAPALAGSDHLGALVLLDHADLDEADQRILERAAMITALLQLFRRAAAEAEQRVAGELLHDLVNGRAREDGVAERARLLGAELDGPQSVVVARCGAAQRARAALAAAHLAHTRHGLAAAHEDHVDVLLPGLDPRAAAELVAKELGAATGTPVTAGGAGPVTGLAPVPAAHAEAARTAQTLVALGREGTGADAADLGFVGFVLGERPDVASYVTTCLGPLLEYDERRGTTLVATLEAYFRHGQSPARASQDLHVHVNTVSQRLDRIGQLLGEGWQQPERALELQVALRLHRLLVAAPG